MNKRQTENKTEIKTKSKAMIFLMHTAHKGSKTFVKTVCTTVQSNNSFLFKWVVSCWKIDLTSCISAFDWHFFVIYTAPMQGNTAMQYVLLNALLVRNVTGTQAGATRWAQLQADRNTHINERELRRLRLAVKGDSSFPSPCVWLGNGWFLAGESLVAVMTARVRCLPGAGQWRCSAQLWQKEEGNPSLQFTCPKQGPHVTAAIEKVTKQLNPCIQAHQSETHSWEILREGGHLENGLMSSLWSRTPSRHAISQQSL